MVHVNVINVGSLGSWDPENDITLKCVGLSPKQIGAIANVLTAAAVKESYSLYLSHITEKSYSSAVHYRP